MPFIENHARLLHVLGAPLTPFYALGTAVRNHMYDRGTARSTSFPFPVICVGNLCAGGSGKTPATEYLVRLLSPFYHVGVVSRGYGRSTKGNLLAQAGMDSSQIGDEPLQYLRKFGTGLPHGFSLYLAARRVEGIERLRQLQPRCSPVVLDDAFQHRAVRAGLNILLTGYDKPYFQDRLLPMGNLREGRRQAERADIIVVTKCPPEMREEDRRSFLSSIKPLPHQEVYFSCIGYEEMELSPFLVLLTGIAHPQPMVDYLRQKGFHILRHFCFGDHHAYTVKDLRPVAEACRLTDGSEKKVTLLTTEKDYARLDRPGLRQVLEGCDLRTLPIRMRFLFGEGEKFDRRVFKFVESYEN